MLGSGILVAATPFALGYAAHARRRGSARGAGTAALALAALETAVLLVLIGLWLRSLLPV